MKRNAYFVFFCLLIAGTTGCKKDAAPKPDYSCNCGSHGKNLASVILDRPLSLIPYCANNSRWGYMDASGKTVVEPKYANALRFSNGRGLIVDNSQGKEFAGFLDEEGNMAIEPKFRYVYAYFSKEGLIPLMNVQLLKIGFLDRNGNVKVPFLYSGAGIFHEGLATVANGMMQGAIDASGTLVIPMDYIRIDMFSEGVAFVNTAAGKHGYINPKNEYVIEGAFTEGGWFIDGLAWVYDPVKRLYGYIRKNGTYLTEPKYQGAGNFWEGYAAVCQNGKWGFIDENDNTKIGFKYDDVAGGFSEGLVAVEMAGKWGYINQQGYVEIMFQFDDADVFVCGVALVYYSDGSHGFINTMGQSIWRSDPAKKESPFTRPKKMARWDKFGFQPETANPN